MKASEQIENVQELIVHLLKTYPRYRDNVKSLSSHVWSIQVGGIDKLKSITAHDFLKGYCDEETELYSQEYIGRASRKIQEQFIELRGNGYKNRIEEIKDVQKVVRKNLNV